MPDLDAPAQEYTHGHYHSLELDLPRRPHQRDRLARGRTGSPPLDVHRAQPHPYQQVYGLSIVKALPSYEGAPRLEVEGYGREQPHMLLIARLELIGNSVLPRLPVAQWISDRTGGRTTRRRQAGSQGPVTSPLH